MERWQKDHFQKIIHLVTAMLKLRSIILIEEILLTEIRDLLAAQQGKEAAESEEKKD